MIFQLAGVLRFGCLLLRLDLHQTLTTRNVRAIETQGDWLPGEKPQAREVEWIVLGCLARGCSAVGHGLCVSAACPHRHSTGHQALLGRLVAVIVVK
ncbi:MAG: hypothetical protein CMJ70_15170 [Planctomycetaceae bacterium]|nr:hypothetical protein [Planctomycetaceae bacterium]